MEKIFLISGKAGHGKNTIADIMSEHLEYHGKRCISIANADFLKFIVSKYFNWNGKKDEEGRDLLQYVGTDLVRNKLKKPNYWIDRVVDIIKIIENDIDYIFITDCRFLNEIEIPKKYFQNLCTTIRVNRKNYKSTLTYEQQKHPSEASLDNYKFDIYINTNEGFDNLRKLILQTFNFINPIPNFKLGDKVKINNVLNADKAKHLKYYSGRIGHIFSYINIDNKKKYKVLFDIGTNESAYFLGNELELL